jgi:hypothetical protein
MYWSKPILDVVILKSIIQAMEFYYTLVSRLNTKTQAFVKVILSSEVSFKMDVAEPIGMWFEKRPCKVWLKSSK